MRSLYKRLLGGVAMIVCLTVWLGFSFPGGLQRLWRQADQAFKRQKYDEAAKLYGQAAQEHPDQWPLAFNTAAAQAAGKKYAQAIAGFEKIAKSGPPELRQAAEYNAGNSYLAQQQPKEAIEHYKRALYLKPDDLNAKWNLELAKRQQKQQQQKKQQQKKQQEQQKKQQNQPQKPDQQKPQQQPQDRKMDKEQAKRLLQSLSQADRDLQKRMAKERNQGVREARPAKDW